MRCREGRPFVSLDQILRNSLAVCVMNGDGEFGRWYPLLRRFTIPFGGFGSAARHAFTFIKEVCQIQLRQRMSLIGSLAEPFGRFGKILWHSASGIIEHTQTVFRRDDALALRDLRQPGQRLPAESDGTVGAASIGYVIATRLFQLEFAPGVALWLGGLAAGALVVGISGTLAVRSVINYSPVATLRGA